MFWTQLANRLFASNRGQSRLEGVIKQIPNGEMSLESAPEGALLGKYKHTLLPGYTDSP